MITLSFTSLSQFEAFIDDMYLLLHPNEASELAAILSKTQGIQKQVVAAEAATAIPKEK